MSATGEFRMPDVGEGIADAELVQWLVAVGDSIDEDQPLLVVETDKSQVELPSPFSGVVTELRGEIGDTVAVGEVLVTVADRAAAAVGTPVASSPGVHAAPPADGAVAADRPPRPAASPSTRRLAVRLGVDLARVTGTGPHGRILETDVRAFESPDAAPADSPVPAPAPEARRVASRADTVVAVRGLRRRIAESMTRSLQIPHITEFEEIDAGALLAARAALKPGFERDGVRLSVLPLLVKATVRALLRHPAFNAVYDAERQEITRYGGVHVGIATATADGLIVPVVRDADQLSLRRIALEIERVTELARTRKAKPDELGGAGFTITNFGSFGTWLGTPIIRHPEVAIAGFGRITDRVVPVDGEPAVRPMLPLVVATDHRINDGAHLGAFVSDVAAALRQPYLLLD